MNRQKTHALFRQGKEKWNEWAEGMLAERKRLENEGLWAVDTFGRPKREETRRWTEEASSDFFGIM